MSGLRTGKKRILLAGDVGRRPNGFYHIGDEATVYQNYMLYHRAGEFDISLLSWALTHEYLDLSECRFWEMPTGQEGWQRLTGIVAQAGRWKRFPFLSYSAELRDYAELIEGHDLIHISGGGNLNSYYPRQLYSCGLISLLARVLDKPVLMTGQTIGPLSDPTDREVARQVLDAADIVTLRDGAFSVSQLEGLDVYRPQVHVGLDDAFFLEGSPLSAVESFFLPKEPGRARLRVGVSVHSGVRDELLKESLAHALDETASRVPVEVYFIPHIVMSRDAKHDVPFMEGIATRLPAEIPQRLINCQDLMQHPEPVKERIVKGLTAAMDVVVATRYHAVVFALSSGVPVLALYGGEYRSAKIQGLLEMVLPEGMADCAVDLSQTSSEELIQKLNRLIDRREGIQAALLAKVRSWAGRADLNLTLAQGLLKTGRV